MGAGVALLVGPLLLWVSVQLGDEPLDGARIAGEPIPQDAPLDRVLRARAQRWAAAEVRIEAGDLVLHRSRRALGARRPIEPPMRAARRAGRTGNPLVDLGQWWRAHRGRLDVPWTPAIDQDALREFTELAQLRVDRLPIAGVSDDEGNVTLSGQDGRALDYVASLAVLRRALVRGQGRVALPVQRVAAPDPLPLGAPDGALFDDDDEVEQASEPSEAGEKPAPRVGRPYRGPGADGPVLPPRQPQAWLPAPDDDCVHEPPQRRFCDGPRRVPAPSGEAAKRAEALGLGTLRVAGQILREGPDRRWVEAAGSAARTGKLWPVPEGRFGRGFGYVRRKKLRQKLHKGIDIVAPAGTPIRAAAPAIVGYADNRVRGYGNLLILIHPDGSSTFHAHCQQIFVFPGQRVRPGEVVGEVGATGLAMGPHLHFEVHREGDPVDPVPRFGS